MAFWILALKNLWRNSRRTLVTGIAMATGFAGLCLFNGFVYRIERALAIGTIYINHVGHFSIIKKGWLEKGLSKPKAFSINEKTQNEIKDFFRPYQADLRFQIPMLIGTGLISNGCRNTPFYLKGLPRSFRQEVLKSPEFLKWVSFVGKKFAGQDYTHFTDSENPLLITESLARLLNKQNLYTTPQSLPEAQLIDCQSPDKLQRISRDPSVQLITKNFDQGFSAIDANLVGHFMVGFSFLEDLSLEAPLEVTQKLYDTTAISRWILYLNEPDQLLFWKNHIAPLFHAQFPQLEMLSYDDNKISPFYSGTSQFLNSLTIIFLSIAGLAISLAIINSLTISILERSKEIGTLRALGYKESRIAWLLSQEMILLTLTSLMAGWGLSYLIASVVNTLNFKFSPPGASEPIKLQIALNLPFQLTTFLILTVIVCLVSYIISKRRIKISIAQLLIDQS